MTRQASVSYMSLRLQWTAVVAEGVNAGFELGAVTTSITKLNKEFTRATHKLRQRCPYSPTASDGSQNIVHAESLILLAMNVSSCSAWLKQTY